MLHRIPAPCFICFTSTTLKSISSHRWPVASRSRLPTLYCLFCVLFWGVHKSEHGQMIHSRVYVHVCVLNHTLANSNSVLLVRVSACWSLSWNSLGVRIAGAKKRRKKNPLMARYFTSCKNEDESLNGDRLPRDKLRVKVTTNTLTRFPLCVFCFTLTSFSGSVNCSSTLLCSCLKATLITGGHWSTELTIDSMMLVK